MLAVHWTPVNNTKKILKNGIRKSKKGLFCFPLTGHKQLDKWWMNFFNQCGNRNRKKYNGIVFRIKKEDLPGYFGHWVSATNRDNFEKEITTLKSLTKQYREILLWRMGEELARVNKLDEGIRDYKLVEKLYFDLAEKELKNDSKAFNEKLSSLDLMLYSLEDYQIVLSHPIAPDRILEIIPQGNEFGRVLRQKKKLEI